MATRSSASALLLAAAGAIGTSCGGDEFCAEGSYECSGTTPTAGAGAGGSGGSSGTAAGGGDGATGGTAASGAGGGAASGGTAALGGEGGLSGGAAGTSGTVGGSTGASGTGEPGGAGAAGSGNTGPVPCDTEAPVAECVVDSKGVFVSATTGDDENKGTSQGAPVKTLARALVVAAGSGDPIYVCAGTYKERLVVTTDGLAIHGGYTCAGGTWTYDGVQAKIAPSAEGEVLELDGVDGFSATDVELTARNATAAGGSSVAVFVKDSEGVEFTRVRVVAGKGVDGANGQLEPYEYDDVATLNGNDADGNNEGDGKACTCEGPGLQSIGAAGGEAGQAGGQGEPVGLGGGDPGTPGASCTNGGLGNDADDVSDSDGALALGEIASSGWAPEAGGDGAPGAPGQGGGGGGGAATAGLGAGGGGACGGCGGKGGAAGTGGGASIAILVFRSDVEVVDSKLQTGDAGDGGSGTGGQIGQDGGARGAGSGLACNGGNGGSGADGGAAGGGAGGISVGILRSANSMVSVDLATSFAIGDKGLGGAGAGADNDGVAGIAEEQQEL